MPLSHSDCLFIHIPKCAGTSVEVALGIADEYPEIGLKPTSTQPHFASMFGGGLQHLTIKEIVRNFPQVITRKGLYSFSVIRDPVKRFVSYFVWNNYRFSDVSLDDDKILNAFLEETERLVSLSHILDIFRDPFNGFEYCQGDTQSFPLNDIRRHLLPQCAFIFAYGTVPIDAIYPIDNMTLLERDLKRRGALLHPIQHRMVGKACKALREIIPASAELIIQEVYRHDMRLNAFASKTLESIDGGFCARTTLDAIKQTSGVTMRTSCRTDIGQTGLSFPRQLWMYWHQGWSTAPKIVQKCVESWLVRNQSWKINLLTSESLHSVVCLPSFYTEKLELPLPALSDVIRIHILAQHGGVWADATTWCVRPLDEWLEKVVVKSGFFAFAKPKPDRPFSSWFLAAFPRHKIVERLKEATDELWRQNTEKLLIAHITDDFVSKDYFWFHKLFGSLLQTDREIAHLWEMSTEVLADAPHFLQFVGLTNPATADVEFHIHNKLSNVYKLTRRVELPNQIQGTVLDTLFRTL